MKTNTVRMLAWLAAQLCFWVGDFISRPLMRFDGFAWLYPTYNTLMGWSCTLSDRYNLGIWLNPPEKEYEPDYD